MNNELLFSKGDKLRLKSYTYVEIDDDQFNEPYVGPNTRDNSTVIFNRNDIDFYKLHNIRPIGGDKTNVWFFNTNVGYPNDSITAIANWAKYEQNALFIDLSLDEILKYHIFKVEPNKKYEYWYGSEMIVLFYDITLLDICMRIDIEDYLKSI